MVRNMNQKMSHVHLQSDMGDLILVTLLHNALNACASNEDDNVHDQSPPFATSSLQSGEEMMRRYHQFAGS